MNYALHLYSRRGETVRSTSLEVKGKGIRGVADKEAYTVHTTNIISQRQYFVVRCLTSYVGNVFGLHTVCVFLLYTYKLVT
jgi:hypothetical protein